MRAIIIDDKDAVALVEKLKLEKFVFAPERDIINICESHHMSKKEFDSIVESIHEKFHYIVVSWLQDQGAKLTK